MSTDKNFHSIGSKTIVKPPHSTKDKNVVNVRKFCRMVERNMNNYQNLNFDSNGDANRNCRGFFMKIDSVNGIKKSLKNNKIPEDKNYYLRFFLTFFNNKTSQFYGNTFKSPLLDIKFNDSGHYELVDEPLYVYFLTEANATNTIVQSGSQIGASQISVPNSKQVAHQCIIEVVFVETNKNNYILSQTCEGWGIVDITEEAASSNQNQNQNQRDSIPVYLGTPRSLLNKSSGLKNLFPIGGASIIYSCSVYKELEKLKFLMPNYVILGYKDQLPGLLFNYLPKKPILNEPIKLFEFSEIYFKNVEIEISPNLESRLIYFATMYRKQKYELGEDAGLNPVFIKERKLRCCIHNSWTFINSNGLENFVSLSKKENFLFYKGVHYIDNFFNNDYCGLTLELSYTLSLPGPNNQREDYLHSIIGYSVIVPGAIDNENNFRTANLITGPGVTLYGEYLYDAIDSDDKVIKVNYIVSKSKDNYDKTYKEREIEDIKNQMEMLKKSMTEEYNKMLTNKDMEKETLMRKKEKELEEMEERLKDSQRSLKNIYGKEDKMGNLVPSRPASEIMIPTGEKEKRGNSMNFNNNNNNNGTINNNQFDTRDNFSPDEAFNNNEDFTSDRKIIEEMGNNNFNSQINYYKNNLEKNVSVLDENTNNYYDKESNNNKGNISKKPTTKTLDQIKESKQEYNLNNYNNHNQSGNNQFYENDNRNNNFESGNSFVKKINTRNDSQPTNDRDEFIFYKMFYQKNKNETRDNNSGNMDKNTPKIIYDQSSKDISRRDKADLISRGLINLESSEKSDNLLNFAFEKELKDEKKANSFIFHFLAYKPLNDIKDYSQIPDRIFFRFNFWDFEFFSTNVAIVSKPNSSVIPSSTPLILQRENSVLNTKSDEKEMKIQIDFDPSVDPYMDYKDFINYLLNKQLFIEIYEAEKLFFIGYIKIPLRDLLRQGKASVYQTKEFEIYDDKFNVKGYIQLLLKSNGVSTNKQFHYDANSLKVINTKDQQLMPKKKKIMSKPLDVDKMIKQEQEMIAKTLTDGVTVDKKLGVNMNNNNMNEYSNLNNNNKTMQLNVDSEMQKRLRAMKYVNNSSSLNNNLMFSDNKIEEMKVKQEKEDQFYKTLNYANRLKEMKKKEILSKTVHDNNKNTLCVSLVLGQPFFTNFILHNNSDSDELYHLIVTKTNEGNDKDGLNTRDEKKIKQISDPTNNTTNQISDTVEIINSPEEWKYLTENHSMVRPNDYQSISSQNYLVIKPNESIPILIKLLSYNSSVANSNYNIWVYKKSGQAANFLTVTIVKVFPLIDHGFRYYMPETRYSTVKIPNPFKYDKLKTAKVLDNYLCTDAMTNLQLDPATNDFYFKSKMQSEGHKNEFYLFIYMDAHKSNLYATWKFEIYSLPCIDVHAQIGCKITQKLQMEAERIPRTIQFFSSNVDVLFFPEKFNSPIVLVPNIPNEFKYVIYPKREENNDILIHCVDISNRELLRGWLVRILPEKPEINHIHNIDCKVGSVTNIKYEFTNSLNSWVIFNFESNNTEILNTVDSRLPFNPNEKKYININIAAQSQMGRAEVLVFVSDSEELYSETLLFQLNYK